MTRVEIRAASEASVISEFKKHERKVKTLVRRSLFGQ